jgi:putative PIN family toxin of toxin-antitoxin system
MRLAVLDTNVIISAGIKPASPPAKLVMDWVLEGRVKAVTSPAIVDEYRRVARRPKFRPYGFPPFWLEFLIEESLHVPGPLVWNRPLPDPEDASFLALAYESGAWLVSGNMKHFPVSARNGVTVLSPADYLAHLTGKQ